MPETALSQVKHTISSYFNRHGKFRLRGIMLALFIVMCLHGFAATDAVSQPHAEKRLIAVIPADLPPYYFLDQKTGKPAGLAVEITNALARRAGLQVEYRFAKAWEEIDRLVQSSEADLIPLRVINPATEQQFLFSEVLDVAPINYLVRATDSRTKGIFPGCRIGVMKNSTAATKLKDRTDISVIPYESLQLLLMDLVTGQLDLVLTFRNTFMQMAEKAGLEEHVRVIEPPALESRRAMALHPANHALKLQLDAAIRSFHGSPEYLEIFQRWMGKPKSWWTVKRAVAVLGTIAGALLLALLFQRFFSIRRLNQHLQADRVIIREERETLAAITNAMGEGLLVQDTAGQLLYLNPKTEELLGHSANDLRTVGVHTLIHRHGTNEQGDCPILYATSHGEHYSSSEELFATADGRMLPVEVIATPLIRSDVNVGSVTLFRDISRQKAAQQQILRMNRLYAALSATNHAIVQMSRREDLYREICRIAVELAEFKAAYVGIASEDCASLIPVASAGEDAAIKTGPITILHTNGNGCKLSEILPTRTPHICRQRCAVSDMIERNGVCLGAPEIYVGVYPLSCDGRVIAAMVLYSDTADAFDEQQQALLEEMSVDISFALDTLHRHELHQQAEDELQRISNFDALTGLPNRALMMDRIGQAITAAEISRSTLGLILIGLDRFKEVNNSFGHGVGDLVLKETARRLLEVIPRGATLARPGSDEFLVLAPDLIITDCVHRVAAMLSAVAGKPMQIAGLSLSISARAGISIWPDDTENGAALFKNAYTALSRAKQGDEGSYQFFTTDMTARSLERLTLENDLRKALNKQQFELYYQPKIDIATGRLSGCEALVRWHRPDQGVVGPDRFIPCMEETGLIRQLGDWVLHEACQQAMQWRQFGMGELRMAVNLSPVQFTNKAIVADINRILQATGFPPHLLELEITESTAMLDIKRTILMLEQLKALGLKIAIDDFGTGYSSLSYLKRLSVDILKIDRSFIKDLPNDKEDCAITEAILALAQNLGMQVVAEGVETAEQLAFIKERNCRYVQGYYFARPLPANEFVQFAEGLRNTP